MPTHTGRVFEIYSIGDGLFMRRVIDSIAAMSNAGLFIQLVALSLMIGLLVMGFKSIMSGGQKMDIASTFVGILLGMIMFGMKADVVIHDMNYAPGEYTVNSYPVANVPFGVAAAGYVISGVSYNLTLKMEQGFGLYSASRSTLIEGGFGNTLEWINSIRAWREPALDSMRSNVAGTDQDLSIFRQNLGQYMNRCVIPGIHMGHKHLPTMMRAGDVFSDRGIKYEHNMLMTEYVSNSLSPPEILSCTNAYARLDVAKDFIPQNFAKGIAMASGRNAYSTDGKSAEERMDEAYNAIGVSSSEMQKLIVSEVVGMSLQNAILGDDKFNSLDKSTKIMVEQAAAQRAVQWAAEETMFRRIMRPMMAFFEALLYALAPFMALLIGFGSYGLQLIGKYMMISIWVSLWLPMLSIIELFQVTMAQHAIRGMRTGLDGISGNPTDFTSIAGAHNLSSQAVEWLGTGAAMAAMTPALTLMLVWGGSVTASALAGRMQGSDTINEKVAAPDVVQASPGVTVGALSERTAAIGSTVGGGAGFVPTIVQSQGVSKSMQSIETRMNALSAQMQEMRAVTAQQIASASNSVSANASTGQTGSTGITFGASAMTGVTGNGREGKSANQNTGWSMLDSYNQQNTNNASLSPNAFGFGAGTSWSQNFNSGYNSTTQGDIQRTAGWDKTQVGSAQRHTNATTGVQQQDSTGLSAQQTRQLSEQLSKNQAYQKMLQEHSQLQQAYNEMSQFAKQAGTEQRQSVLALSKQQIDRGNAGNIEQAFYASGYTNDDLKTLESRISPYSHDSSNTRIAAMILGMHEGAMSGDAYKAAIYADAMHGDPNSTFYGGLSPEAFRNSGISAEEAQGVGRKVADQVSGINIDGEAIEGKVAAGLHSRSEQAGMLRETAGQVGANVGGHAYGSDPNAVDLNAVYKAGEGFASDAVNAGNSAAAKESQQIWRDSYNPNKADYTAPVERISNALRIGFQDGSLNSQDTYLGNYVQYYKDRGLDSDQALALGVLQIMNRDNDPLGGFARANIGKDDLAAAQKFVNTNEGRDFVNRFASYNGSVALEAEIMNNSSNSEMGK